MDFVDFFEFMGDDLGMWDSFLPFLLIFTIMYAALQKTQVLGQPEEAKKFNLLISAVIGFLVVIPHVTNTYPPGRDIVVIINSALPDVAAVLVAIVLALIMANLVSQKSDGSNAFTGSSWPAYIALLIVAYIFGAKWFGWELFDLTDATINLVVILLVFGLVFWFIWGFGNNGPDPKKSSGGQSGEGNG